MGKRSKRVLVSILTNRRFNKTAVPLLGRLRSVIPSSVLSRVPVVGVIRVPIEGDKELFLCNDGSDGIASALHWGGSLEAFEGSSIRLFNALLDRSSTVIDVGANTGLYAIVAAHHSPEKRVIAFEPVPRVCAILRRNVEVNHVDNVEVVEAAASDHDGSIDLYIPTTTTLPTSSSTLEGFRPAEETVKVKAIRLDTYVQDQNIDRVDLLKIDTEATEHIVLHGAKEVLTRDEPIVICEVLAGRTESQLQTLLSPLGYRFFRVTSEGLSETGEIKGDPTYREMNFLFVTARRMDLIQPLLKA